MVSGEDQFLLDSDSSVPVAWNPSLTLREEPNRRPVSRLAAFKGSETQRKWALSPEGDRKGIA